MSVKRFAIEPAEGLAPQVGLLFGGMGEVRAQLREAVESLSDEALARRSVAGCHSIGALVLHIGEAEWYWMNCVVAGRELTREDRKAVYWDALERERAGRETVPEGMTARRCLDIIDELRERTTRATLAALGDEDLERVFTKRRREGTRQYTLRWILHHLIDHEAQHKGQILMLKRISSPES